MNYSDERFTVTLLKTDPNSKHFKISRKIDGFSLDLIITNIALSNIEKYKNLDLFIENQIEEGKKFVDTYELRHCEFFIDKEKLDATFYEPITHFQLKTIMDDRT